MIRLALLPLLALATPPTADDDKALDKLQGTWNVVRYVYDGKEETPPADKPETLVIKKSKYELKRAEHNFHGELKLDASTSPWKIDASLYDKDDKKRGNAVGIYKFEGEKLIVCWDQTGENRPTQFGSDSGSKSQMIVLEKKDAK